MHQNRIALLAAVIAAATLSACDTARQVGQESSAEGTCGTCHGNPPTVTRGGTPHSTSTDCHACHPTSVDASGNVIPVSAGGTHGDGKIQGGGHEAGYAEPSVHGPEAIAALSSCKTCHGDTYDGSGGTPSCNKCHADHGFDAWQTNCTFCHGTQTASYTAAKLTMAAPPKSVAGSAATSDVAVGAHARHLAAGYSCGECHDLPTDLAHVDGQPATVKFGSFAGATATWDRKTATCSNVYCHGATLSGGSITQPLWTKVDGTQAECRTCHGTPPSSPHVDAAISECVNCHPGSVDASGAIVPNGNHLNGVVDGYSHPSNWADRSQHGYQAQKNISGCGYCHGPDYAGGASGVSCTACHQKSGYADWKTNCTFCHGQQTAAYASAGAKAAPPDGVKGEQDPTDVHVGAHARHVAAGSFSAAIACDVCHPAVSDALGHFSGGRATVSFSGVAGASSTYTPTASSGTCSVYCHGKFTNGADATPAWTSTTHVTCTSCHGLPPPSPHPASSVDKCVDCHPGTVDGNGAILPGGKHLNGVVDGPHPSNYADPGQHGYQAEASLASCKTCHGDDFAGGITGVSCTACHEKAGYTDWKTNCTFCHGTQTPGFNASTDLFKAAPPDGVQGQQDPTDVHVGAHGKHVVDGKITAAIACDVCHPAVSDALAHFSGARAQVAFSGVAGASSTYSASNTCTVYCHGASASPAWTSTADLTCASCHGAPPATGLHTSRHPNVDCGKCHPGYSKATASANLAVHLNGTNDPVTIQGTNGPVTYSSWPGSCRCHAVDGVPGP